MAMETSEQVCPETPADESADLEKSLLAIAKEVNHRRRRSPRFEATMISLSADRTHAQVDLCTGRTLDVPLSLLKNVKYLGTMESCDAIGAVASAEFDISTDAGWLVQQLASELTRVSRARFGRLNGKFAVDDAISTDNDLSIGKPIIPRTMDLIDFDLNLWGRSLGRERIKIRTPYLLVGEVASATWTAPEHHFFEPRSLVATAVLCEMWGLGNYGQTTFKKNVRVTEFETKKLPTSITYSFRAMSGELFGTFFRGLAEVELEMFRATV